MTSTYQNQGWGLTGTTACGDADTWQYHFVKGAETAKRFEISTGASGPTPIGVAQNDPRSGQPINVKVAGGTLVYADASTGIEYLDWITSGSDGQAVKASGSTVHGFALEAVSTGASILMEAMLLGPQQSAIIDNTP